MRLITQYNIHNSDTLTSPEITIFVTYPTGAIIKLNK